MTLTIIEYFTIRHNPFIMSLLSFLNGLHNWEKCIYFSRAHAYMMTSKKENGQTIPF